MVKERAQCDFDQNEMYDVWFAPSAARTMQEKVWRDMEEDPKMAKSHKEYEYSPKELQEMIQKKMNYIWYNKERKSYFSDFAELDYYWGWDIHGYPPISMHQSMF